MDFMDSLHQISVKRFDSLRTVHVSCSTAYDNIIPFPGERNFHFASIFFFPASPSCSSLVYNKSQVIRQTTTIYDNYSRCKSILWYFNALIRFLFDSFLNCRRRWRSCRCCGRRHRRRRCRLSCGCGRSHSRLLKRRLSEFIFLHIWRQHKTYIAVICIVGASVRSF